MDEDSTKSDEEYDDLAIQDIQENGYWSENEESCEDLPLSVLSQGISNFNGEKYKRNLNRFLRTESLTVCESMRKKLPSSGNIRVRRRSRSISSVGKDGSILNGYDLSEAVQI